MDPFSGWALLGVFLSAIGASVAGATIALFARWFLLHRVGWSEERPRSSRYCLACVFVSTVLLAFWIPLRVISSGFVSFGRFDSGIPVASIVLGAVILLAVIMYANVSQAGPMKNIASMVGPVMAVSSTVLALVKPDLLMGFALGVNRWYVAMTLFVVACIFAFASWIVFDQVLNPMRVLVVPRPFNPLHGFRITLLGGRRPFVITPLNNPAVTVETTRVGGVVRTPADLPQGAELTVKITDGSQPPNRATVRNTVA